MQENLTNIFGSETKTSPRSSFFVFVDFRKHSKKQYFWDLLSMFFCNHVLGVTHTLHTLDTYIYKYDTIQSNKKPKRKWTSKMPQNIANASASRESIRPSGTTCICQRTQNRGSVFAFLLLCSKCYAMDCLGTNCTHAQTCDNVRVQCATQWTENSFDHRWSPLCFLATIALESLMCQDGEDENPPWSKCAKDSIPPSVRSLLGNPEVNAKFVCVQQYAWHWERAGTDLMAVAGQNVHKPISSAWKQKHLCVTTVSSPPGCTCT